MAQPTKTVAPVAQSRPVYSQPPPAQSYSMPSRQPYGYNTYPSTNYYRANQKDAGVAVILSLLFPGLGQFYNGESDKGVAFLLLGIFSAVSVIFFFGFILYPLVWIISMWDAGTRARRINAVNYARSTPPPQPLVH